ncbi:pantoate--beta-alanine ligase PAN6 Ecym_4023 [Eremothecium cymbalariae DBVPG|uniref:Pantoate--beta-alanine ligase n=1 Tax=Eremothecium cymbalariae (strain CBS 270.75 / DBVPG 7215 / KCTC 17166 / NRRL Y-17582) TaxID=931890 RepID=G8JSV3_ERECY|nr:hypothetical protein Ecym_4023 [Eremothecium cymbalariae DBVPG\
MLVVKTVKDAIDWRKATVNSNARKLGFVATMGCLHLGHLSLVERSVAENDFTAVSIFVNPAQFAPDEDLAKYPRTLEADLDMLEQAGVDMVFVPSALEIYSRDVPLEVSKQEGTFVSVHGLSELLEGRTRPNFFRGVVTVVSKLLNIFRPDRAYWGQKDFQQYTVLNAMTKDLFMDVEMVLMPIVRSVSGLALSSRNKYLSPESLDIASNINAGLRACATLLENSWLDNKSVSHEDLVAQAKAVWDPYVASGDFEIDYISIANANTLRELVPAVSKNNDVVISCAVYVKDRRCKDTIVRLIDNILIKTKNETML